MTEEQIKEQKAKARRDLWRAGILRWKLDTTQELLYDLFYSSAFKIMTWLLSRRQGKTFTLCILAIEQCLRKKNAIVKFVSPTKVQVNNNVRPILRQILEDCPEEIKPVFSRKDYIYFFPNGSEIQLAGTDNGHAEKLRGGDSDIFIIDEAGTCADLDNVVKSILLPTTLITKGRGILASTPPKESDHDFLRYIEDAEAKGSLIKKTVHDNPRITPEQVQDMIDELGGPNAADTRRELYCEIIKDPRLSALPDFDESVEKKIVKEWPKPPFYDAYESMDTGGKDLTVVLYGYFDFRADKVIIEDETVINFQNPDDTIKSLVKNINEKEMVLWKNPISFEYKAPHRRVSDIDYILTTEILKHSDELPKEQKINFEIAKKDNFTAALADLRIMLKAGKVIIHPRCKTLINHLRHAKWNKSKTDLARSTDEGHYDALPALVYFIRCIEYKRNPYPSSYDYSLKDLFVRTPDKFGTQPNNQLEVYKKIFGIRPKRKY